MEEFGIVDYQAVGTPAARPYGFNIDFVRNHFSESSAWIFVIILKFIFTPIFEIKSHEKISWHQILFISWHQFHFRRPILRHFLSFPKRVTKTWLNVTQLRCATWNIVEILEWRPWGLTDSVDIMLTRQRES